MYRKLYSDNQVMLLNEFRELWEQHVMWTRSFIISTVANLEDLEFVTNRLLKNATDMAAPFRRFYNTEIADQFEELMRQHLLIAADLINAALKGDAEAAAETRIEWYQNADDIAAFLAIINPYWSQSVWKEMMYDHLSMLEHEVSARIQGRYQEDIAVYDDIQKQALMMADVMSEGIIRQFGV
ncbi:MAG: hypothetical protein K0R92_769 [Lachnospiraceae bacterium]|jgi:hypothetical protein|nr:hypothetical protein [Lachnospiraceae bacterium]